MKELKTYCETLNAQNEKLEQLNKVIQESADSKLEEVQAAHKKEVDGIISELNLKSYEIDNL